MRPGDDAESVKPPETTVRSMVAVAVTEDEVPMIVRVEDASEAVLAAVKVRVLLVVASPGLKAAVTPVGSPETVSATVPSKLFNGTTVIVSEPCLPRCTLRLVDDADNVKPGGGGGVIFDDELLHEPEKARRAATPRAGRNRASCCEKQIIMAF